jgi:hypothetical protein
MLKISMIDSTKGSVKIRIDGQISGEGVKLFQRLAVDLQNVSFVDRDGVAVLRTLQQFNVRFLNAPLFITEQIGKPRS